MTGRQAGWRGSDEARPGGGLGGQLRHWRARTTPEAVGLARGCTRRTHGLRREELAVLAGISTDYVSRLEQGRARTPSAQVLSALATALRLTEQETTHLFLLAGRKNQTETHIPRHVSPSIRRLIDKLGHTPVSVHDAAWNLLLWNPVWAALMGDPSGLERRERNLLWRHFTGRPTRVRCTARQLFCSEKSLVANLASAAARYPGDPGLPRLVRELRAASRRFSDLWGSRPVGSHVPGARVIVHPEVGTIRLDRDVLSVPGHDMRVVAYTAPHGSEDADKLRLLSVIGLETYR